MAFIRGFSESWIKNPRKTSKANPSGFTWEKYLTKAQIRTKWFLLCAFSEQVEDKEEKKNRKWGKRLLILLV